MNLLKAITTVGGFTMLSRVFGFVRDMLIAGILGAGPIADAFFVAFKIPNLFRRLFAEGAFSAAFVPIYAGKLEGEGKAVAKEFAESAFALMLFILLLFVAAIELAMPVVMQLFAPGFMDDPEKFDLTVVLTRITFPYLLFISLVSLMAGVLNSNGRFAAAAATPILLNISLIGAILLLSPYMPSPGHALAWGVFCAGIVQFIWLFGALARDGFWLRLRVPKLTKDIRTLLTRALPVALGAGIYQINLVIDTIIASLLPSGSISYLFYADRITQLPLGVVGVAVGTALLPMLARQVRSGDASGALHAQNRAVEFSLLLTLPAAVAIFVMADPIVTVLFQRGAFGVSEAAATMSALAIYALGLPAYVLVKCLTPAFFAREDTKTPVIIAVIAMVVNLVLNLILMGPFLHVGIAMATVASAWLNTALLAAVLMKRGELKWDSRLKTRLPRTLAAAALMGIALYWLQAVLALHFEGGEIERILALSALVIVGLAIYGLGVLTLRAVRVTDLGALRRAKS